MYGFSLFFKMGKSMTEAKFDYMAGMGKKTGV